MLDQDAKPRKKPFARLLADLKKRYPSADGETTTADHSKPAAGEHHGTSPATHDPKFEKRIGKLPREAGVLLVVIGVAGLLLPGPVGSPFVLAGAWPSGPRGSGAWKPGSSGNSRGCTAKGSRRSITSSAAWNTGTQGRPANSPVEPRRSVLWGGVNRPGFRNSERTEIPTRSLESRSRP